jgi:putative DNA primase/helicase
MRQKGHLMLLNTEKKRPGAQTPSPLERPHPPYNGTEFETQEEIGAFLMQDGDRMNDATRPSQEKIKFTDMKAIKPEMTDWLWKDWLAAGELNLIAGVPSTGKTTLALSFAAAISAGNSWPDGTRAPTGNVIIWSGEDDFKKTIYPRLLRMGADRDHIMPIEARILKDGGERPFYPPTDIPALQETITSMPGGASLLIIDPIVSAIGSKANSHNNVETRNALQPIRDLAEATGCAVLGITHFAKGTAGRSPIERIIGSQAFGALPRSVMIAAKNESGDPARLLIRTKCNLGEDGGGFGYDLIAGPLHEYPEITAIRVDWRGFVEGSPESLLAMAEGEWQAKQSIPSRLEEAKAFLAQALENGERPQKELEAEALKLGISLITLRRAADKSFIHKRPDGRGGPWIWGLKGAQR